MFSWSEIGQIFTMQSPRQSQHDAISRLKTNLDRILEETEYILKTEKVKSPVGSQHSFAERQSRPSIRGKQDLTSEMPRRSASSTFEAVNVLLEILQKQEELTVEEYTINNSTFKVLVIEDTEF